MFFKKAERRYNFKYRGKSIEQLPTFNYVGIVFTSNGTFHNAIKTLFGKANRALSDLFTITRGKEIPLTIMLDLFDSFVASIMYYSSEVWGFLTSELVERLHRKFLKRLLKVNLHLAILLYMESLEDFHSMSLLKLELLNIL